MTASVGLCGTSIAADPPPAAQAIRFDIEPQPLAAALNALALQSQQQILFTPEIAQGKTTQGVKGTMTADSALAQLLMGTGLSASRTADGMILVSPTDAKGASTSPHPLDAPQGATNEAPRLEEIIVTAQKRAERLIDVPQSVSVVSGDNLARLNAVQFRDFADTVPGLNFATAGAGFTQISLRGVTTGNDVSSTVGIYVDEVPYGSSTAFALSAQFALDAALFDLDRVEILRGPQGTLYGASAMGGLIKYVTRQPDTGQFAGSVQTGISTTHDGGISYNLSGVVNLPLVTDLAALRVSGFESHDGGYIDNLATGLQDVNRSDTYGGRLDLLLTPAEGFSVRLNAFLQNISRDGEATADYTFAGAQPNGSLGQFREFAEPFDQQFRVTSATVNYSLNRVSLTSITSYQSVHTRYVADISASYVPLLNAYGFGPYSAVAYANPLGTDKFTQEVRLMSPAPSRPLEWVVGAFYTHEGSTNDQQFLLRDPAGLPAPNTLYSIARPSIYKEYAAFADLTWHFIERFDVTGGARYARNEQTFSQTGSGPFGFSLAPNDSSQNVVTYLGNARYHFSDQVTAYLRYATGYRPGGPNVLTVAGGPRTFEADRLKSYELGLKAQTADQRFGIDLSAYDIDWTNVQLLIIDNGFGVYTNARGGATVQGSELTLTARALPDLTLSGAFAYQHAYLRQADDDVGASAGERLPNVPRFTGSLNADYKYPLDHWSPTIGATLRHVSDRFSGFDNAVHNPNVYPQYHLPEYTGVDLRTGVETDSLAVTVYVHNLFDERGQLGVLLPQFGARVAIMQPRTFGLNVSTRF